MSGAILALRLYVFEWRTDSSNFTVTKYVCRSVLRHDTLAVGGWKRSASQSGRFNRLTPNDPYMGRTAPLTSKRCILYIYSTNIGTEYFKHALNSPLFLFKMQFVS